MITPQGIKARFSAASPSLAALYNHVMDHNTLPASFIEILIERLGSWIHIVGEHISFELHFYRIGMVIGVIPNDMPFSKEDAISRNAVCAGVDIGKCRSPGWICIGRENGHPALCGNRLCELKMST